MCMKLKCEGWWVVDFIKLYEMLWVSLFFLLLKNVGELKEGIKKINWVWFDVMFGEFNCVKISYGKGCCYV